MSQRIFGFSGASTVTGERDRDLANARALGNALLFFCCASWAFCFLMYSGGLHGSAGRAAGRSAIGLRFVNAGL